IIGIRHKPIIATLAAQQDDFVFQPYDHTDYPFCLRYDLIAYCKDRAVSLISAEADHPVHEAIVKITHLKTNHIVNPLGFAIEQPTFSWMVEDTFDTVQTAAQILVSLDGDFERIIFDSGKVVGSGVSSLAYRPPIPLKPRTRYFWKVRVWGETESAESEVAWFETAKIDEGWQAEW